MIKIKIGAGLALIFSIIGFIIALYDIFSMNSGVQGTAGAWWVGLFTLLSLIFSGAMFTTQHPSIPILAIILCDYCWINWNIFNILVVINLYDYRFNWLHNPNVLWRHGRLGKWQRRKWTKIKDD